MRSFWRGCGAAEAALADHPELTRGICGERRRWRQEPQLAEHSRGVGHATSAEQAESQGIPSARHVRMVGIPLEKSLVESRRRRIIARARQDGGRLQQHGRHRPALGRAVDGAHRRRSGAGDIARLQQALRQEQRRILRNRRRPPHRIRELAARLPRLPGFHEREPRGEPVAQLRRQPHDRRRRNTRRRRGRCRRDWRARHRHPAVRHHEPAGENSPHPMHRSQSNKPTRHPSAEGARQIDAQNAQPSRRRPMPAGLKPRRMLKKVQLRGGARRSAREAYSVR